MDGIYILKTFTSWYSIGLNRHYLPEKSDQDDDSSTLREIFDNEVGYENKVYKDLWIDRSTCQISESNTPLTEEEVLEEVKIDAFLGIVEVLNTYHLGIVKRSELVAELEMEEISFSKNKSSQIWMMKEVKFLPIQSQSENMYSLGTPNLEDISSTLSPNNLGNLTNIQSQLSLQNISGQEQIQLQLEVQKIIDNMEKIMSTGYYYSHDTELTNTLQNLHLKEYVPFRNMIKEGEKGEEALKINKKLYEISNKDFNWTYKSGFNIPKRWMSVVIQGYIGYKVNYINEERIEFLLIGRRNIKRPGTRFVARGIDEDGNVGNFVESEFRIRINEGKWYSFTQNRGSVPVFWEQINFSSPVTLYNYHHNYRAFCKHINILKQFYNPADNMLFINLLDIKENEKVLSESFMQVVDEYNNNNNGEMPSVDKEGMIELVNYNYNVNAKWNTHEVIINYILENLKEQVDRIGYFETDKYIENKKEGLQKGVIRTNCLDCLDRTNIFQWVLGWIIFKNIFKEKETESIEEEDKAEILSEKTMGKELKIQEENIIFNSYTELWCNHGDYISIHYSGTPSTMSERVKQTTTSINSLLYYSKTMVQRVYNSLFQDYQRQMIFNILSPYPSSPSINIQSRQQEELLLLEGQEEEREEYETREIKLKKRKSQDYKETEIEKLEEVLKEKVGKERGLLELKVKDEDDTNAVKQKGEDKIKRKESDSIFDKLNTEITKLLDISKSTILPSKTKEEKVQEERPLEIEKILEFQKKEYEIKEFEKEEEDLKIWVGSWNIGAHEIEVNENLINWMEIKKIECDLYIFSFQEFVELNFINIATGRRDENKENEFENLVANLFNFASTERYEKLTSISMTGLYLVIFVKHQLKSNIKDLIIANVKTGLNYNIGNKGSVGVQFKLYDHNLSFLNLHLNFGKNLNIGRIELLEYILKNSFKDYNKNILDNDIFILAGDFNFQIQLEKQVVLSLLKKMEFSKLFNYDEFNMAKMIGIPILNKLYEPKIHFQPTYKYKDGTKYYTTKRSPAWCDRIIFGGKLFENDKIKILNYKRNDNLITSDHRPISSIILVDLSKKARAE